MPYTPVHDALIIGSGAAGLSLALRLAEHGRRVVVIAKGAISGGSTLYAQGGISAALDAADSVAAHMHDTLQAGAGLCNPAAVEFAATRGPDCIQWLIERGVPFTRATSDEAGFAYHLNQEGGHSHRRIIHAADATGKAVETTLEQLARAQPGIELRDHQVAVDLIRATPSGAAASRCVGAYVLDTRSGRVNPVSAGHVALATGGANMAYLYSSNPHGASGDGVAMAWRAGCRVANMEFMQFHPTCLYHSDKKSFLISEALRGEGAVLRLPNGSRFMPRFDERAELAPRDVVARAIDHEMKRLGVDCIHLDISHRPPDFVREHFPTIYRQCLELGFDLTRAPIPVVPAAHYTCGGVLTDLHARTDLQGLYALGETACTGLHGGNRMASNSLLECLVFAAAAADDMLAQQTCPAPTSAIRPWDESRVTDSDEEVVVSHNWQELRRFMWDYVGIVRSTKRLSRARARLDLLQREIQEYYSYFRVTPDLIELRNLVTVAGLIVDAALSRRESRGLHYTLDYPDRLAVALDTILIPPGHEPSGRFLRASGLAAVADG